LGLVAAVGLGCGHDFYQAYAEAHPGWSPDFPRDEMPLDELLASIHAPPKGRHTTILVTHLALLGLGTDPWEKIPNEQLRSGSFTPDPERLYVLAAEVQCSYVSHHYTQERDAFEQHALSSFVWYAFRDEQLLGYEHVVFEERCRRVVRKRSNLRQVEGFEEKLRQELRNWREEPLENVVK
jgi:hypothetical protein